MGYETKIYCNLTRSLSRYVSAWRLWNNEYKDNGGIVHRGGSFRIRSTE